MATEITRDRFQELMELDKAGFGNDIVVDGYMEPIQLSRVRLDRELVDMYPPSDAINYESFKESIRQYGQRVPVLMKGKTNEVIDGRHRIKALKELRIPYVLVERLPYNYTREQQITELRIRNGNRRDLSATQKGVIAYRDMKRSGMKQAEAAAMHGISVDTVMDAKFVCEELGKSVEKDLFDGKSVAFEIDATKTIRTKSVTRLKSAIKQKKKGIQSNKSNYVPVSENYSTIKDAAMSLPAEDKQNLMLSLKRDLEKILNSI